MEDKIVKKLKHYDNVVSLGRKKYSKDYIDYAKGYLNSFRYVVISDRLGLKNCGYGGMSKSAENGYRKGNSDLESWRAEDTMKFKQLENQAKKLNPKEYKLLNNYYNSSFNIRTNDMSEGCYKVELQKIVDKARKK